MPEAFLDRLQVAAAVLGTLVRGGFGPAPGASTLLFAPPDAPVITSDGHALLAQWRRGLRESRRSPEPVQTLVLAAADVLHQREGDGASEFVLLLENVVTRTLATRGTTPQIALAKAFGDLRHEVEQLLQAERSAHTRRLGLCVAVPMVLERSDVALSMTHQLREATDNVLRSGLAGELSGRTLEFVVQLVVEWVCAPPLPPRDKRTGDDARLLFSRAQRFLAKASDRIMFAQSPSVFASHVVPPDEFVLHKAQLPSHSLADAPVRFVCLTCELSLAAGANHVAIQTATDAELFAAADAARAFVTRFLTRLRGSHGVELLVSSERVDESVAAICARLGIACVQLAERDDVFDLSAAAGVYPLASVFDEVHADAHVGVSSEGLTHVRLQQRPNLWFRGLKQPTGQSGEQQHSSVPQLLLKAPTRGAYSQLYKSVVKALRILRGWWEPSGASIPDLRVEQHMLLYCCRGGGATELAIARHLDASLSPTASAASALVRRSFADALRDVVGVLRSNLAATMGAPPSDASDKRGLLVDLARVSLASDAGDRRHAPLCGYVLDASRTIETLAGAVNVPALVFDDPEAFGLLHPFHRTESLLQAVLQLLEQLFRVDCELRANATRRERQRL